MTHETNDLMYRSKTDSLLSRAPFHPLNTGKQQNADSLLVKIILVRSIHSRWTWATKRHQNRNQRERNQSGI